MQNRVQPYAWGSRTALSELYGLANNEKSPMAELWMGAHPKAPSLVELDGEQQPLDRYLTEHAERALGAGTRQRFGDRLPFLFKVLCAAEPLSIQAHPSLEQARAGFANEERNGPPADAPNRNYRDDNHKPELLCALRPFWGLRGFRPVNEIAAEFTSVELRSLDVPVAPPETDNDIQDFFERLLRLPEDERRDVVAGAIALAQKQWGAFDPAHLPEPGDPLARYYWVQRIADVHPGDIGIVSPLILNTVSLQPGEAVYQPAGVLHAYLSGVGAELMANSDNVLRGGMTVKHIDVDELLSVGVFRPQEREPVLPEPSSLVAGEGADARYYPTPFSEFQLHTVQSGEDAVQITTGAPMIVLCHAGRPTVACEDGEHSLAPGRSCFVEAATERLEIRGTATVYIATVGS